MPWTAFTRRDYAREAARYASDLRETANASDFFNSLLEAQKEEEARENPLRLAAKALSSRLVTPDSRQQL